jgi:hypothetical protein
MELVAKLLMLAYNVLDAFGPYVATLMAGAYLEYKFGAKAKAALQADLLAAKTKLAELEAAVKAKL